MFICEQKPDIQPARPPQRRLLKFCAPPTKHNPPGLPQALRRRLRKRPRPGGYRTSTGFRSAQAQGLGMAPGPFLQVGSRQQPDCSACARAPRGRTGPASQAPGRGPRRPGGAVPTARYRCICRVHFSN